MHRKATKQEPNTGQELTKTHEVEQAKVSTGRAKQGAGTVSEPPRQGEQFAEPPEQYLTPEAGAQGARGRKGDENRTRSAQPRAVTQPRAW
jgi:hypothetical protein